jgi:hypothetical protein
LFPVGKFLRRHCSSALEIHREAQFEIEKPRAINLLVIAKDRSLEGADTIGQETGNVC